MKADSIRHRFASLVTVAAFLALVPFVNLCASAPARPLGPSWQEPQYPLKRDDPRAKLDSELLKAKPIAVREFTPPKGRARGTTLTPVHFDLTTRKEIDDGAPPSSKYSGRGLELDTPSNSGATSRSPKADAGNPVVEPNAVKGKTGKSRSVIGRDDRVSVADTTLFPWSTACKLVMKFPNGELFVGSGTLIEAGSVITAGHCVYSAENGGWASKILVIPGLNGDYMPFGSAMASSVHTTREWLDSADPEGDFALVILDRAVGNDAGWLGTISLAALTGRYVHLISYPGDLSDGLREYYVHGSIESASPSIVFSYLDVTPGTSGGGIFLDLGKGNFRVVAVNTFGIKGINGATRFNSQKARLLSYWLTNP